jgi:hypothetical protein
LEMNLCTIPLIKSKSQKQTSENLRRLIGVDIPTIGL